MSDKEVSHTAASSDSGAGERTPATADTGVDEQTPTTSEGKGKTYIAGLLKRGGSAKAILQRLAGANIVSTFREIRNRRLAEQHKQDRREVEFGTQGLDYEQSLRNIAKYTQERLRQRGYTKDESGTSEDP